MTTAVVGIGASAGGLEAVKLLLAHLSANTGLAFVFVQHLDPKHHSNLTEILTRVSAIPVLQAADAMEIEPNHLYVIPPDAGLEIAGRVLRMTPRAPLLLGPHMPIDRFLRSLAQECGSRAIGVILSGAGTDGTAGLEAVKGAGGMTYAQDPAIAKFASMPQTAIESGCVDFVLSPEAIAAELTKLGGHAYMVQGEDTESLGQIPAVQDQFVPILELLRSATGVDFGLYRANTVHRRIMRRLALRNIGSLKEYCTQIEKDPHELSALHRDLLISVTRFFRDPDSFESLKNLVFPRLVRGRAADAGVRIWVPGCATGEEPYSIAISLQEYFEETGHVYPVQIFASDISSAAVDKARSGKFAESIEADVSPERLNRFFSRVEGGYQVNKELRERCVFSRHDLIQDPPFSKLDLISCRNVLIFFGSVRKNIVALFHFALKPGGILVLGPSETESGNLFSILQGAQSTYTKNETAGKRYPTYSATGGLQSADDDQEAPGVAAGQPTKSSELRKELERTLLSRYNGAGVIVDETLEVLEILGQTAPYLTLPTGKASLNLLKLIPEIRLFLEVEQLVNEVARSGEAARRDRIPYRSGGVAGEVNLEVISLRGIQTPAILVLFEPAPPASGIERIPDSDPRDREIAILKQDLVDARKRLLSLIEEYDTSAERNQDTSEEAISANEELQSLNEELETAKEELQSINEELSTLNEELMSNNALLTEARDFAMLIIETITAPLLVLDIELRIKAANPGFYRAFKMSPRETVGQFLYSVSNGCWDIPRFREMLHRILPDRKSVQDLEIEQDFPGIGHRVLVVSARQLDGLQQILLAIDDVTERKKRADATLQETEERFRTMADTAPIMIWVADSDKARTFFNKGWLAFTGRTMQQELGIGWTENVHPGDVASCMETYSSSFYARRGFQMEYRLRRADGKYRWLLDIGVPRFESDGGFVGYVGSCVDITNLKHAQEENLAKQRLESVGTLASGIAHDFNNLLGAVLAHSELALAELASDSRPEGELQKIRTAAIRGAEIVRQLMMFAGQENEIPELVDVSGIVEDMLDLLKVSVSKHAAVEMDLGTDLPAVRANPGQLRQVVMNLITNASEAIGDRDGVIRVTTRRERLAEVDYLQLEVLDTGRGMTAEMQARVFDPFFTTKLAGHGLGLAVVQGIVRSLGGTIRLVSTLGKGTTFRILLPCAEQTVEGTRSTASRAEEETHQSRMATILVVEDEELLRLATSKILRKNGFSVMEAGDGSAALELIRSHKDVIDVLLLDITLPGASSREVLEEAIRQKPGVITIATSAYNEGVATTSLAGRAEHFIRKPYRLGDLVNIIGKILSS